MSRYEARAKYGLMGECEWSGDVACRTAVPFALDRSGFIDTFGTDVSALPYACVIMVCPHDKRAKVRFALFRVELERAACSLAGNRAQQRHATLPRSIR